MRRAFVGLLVAFMPTLASAATFHCSAGDVACLITSINQANANGKKNTITLEAGAYTLTAINNDTDDTDGPNGLPSITSTLTIKGAGADTTIVERAASAPDVFRLVHVAATGNVTLKKLTLHGGTDGSPFGGGGLHNQGGTINVKNVAFSANHSSIEGGGLFNMGGTVTIDRTLFTNNTAGQVGAGLLTDGGIVTISRTTFASNGSNACAGLYVGSGTLTIADSVFVDNETFAEGGGICNDGLLTLTNSTLTRNSGGTGAGGGIVNSGTTIIINATIADNEAPSGGGIFTNGSLTMQNTILARNRHGSPQFPGSGPECFGPVTSLGNNLIGDTTGCTITLQSTDLVGDPGLGTFTDDGTPGNGHFPLLPTSQAIDAGNAKACPKRDQLGEKRHHPCDIGAIEFPDHP